MKQEIGTFNNETVFYSVETNVIECKNVKVFYRTLDLFVRSGRIRAQIDDKTAITKKEKTYKIGCLEDTHEALNKLHTTIKKIIYESKQVQNIH